MKKILVVFAIFLSLIFVVSCGGGSKTSDTTDTVDTVTDEDTVDTDSTSDTEPGGDTEPSDDSDTAPDNSDPAPDNDVDSGDSVPDSDNEEPVNENPDNLPECSPTSATPCVDPETGLIWSGKSAEKILWEDAVNYCKELNEGGLSGWHLPIIDELKTLLIWSKADSCKVSETDDCLAWDDACWTCETCTEQGTASTSGNTCSEWGDSYSDGKYSKFGETGWFWSSSIRSDNSNTAWGVNFSRGTVSDDDINYGDNVRCVR